MAIANIDAIGVDSSEGVRNGVSTLLATGEAREPERLIQDTDRMSGIDEFGVDGDNNAAQADDHSQNTDRQDEDEFSGDDHGRRGLYV